MKINYIVGNGFDRNLKLKTSYKEFVEVYRKKPSTNQIIKDFKEDLSDINSALWSKLEEYLGGYTGKLKKSEEFIHIFDDLQNGLSEYLITQQDKLKLNSTEKTSIINDFFNPQKYLIPNDSRRLIEFIGKSPNRDMDLTITNFNYTNSVENIFGFNGIPAKISTKNTVNTISRLQSINHVHGLVDHFMIFGVNDESQISNKDLADSIDVKEHIIKPFANDAYDSSLNQKIESNIRNSNLFCLHGVSLGITDQKWWKILGEELIKGKHLVFHKFYANNTSTLNRNKIQPIIREEKIRIMEIFEIPKEKQSEISSQLYIEVGNKTFSNNSF